MGAAKSGVGVASMGVMRPELVMKSIVPVVMAGVYGLIIAVIISTAPRLNLTTFSTDMHISRLASLVALLLEWPPLVLLVMLAGVRANAQQPKLFVGMILILIFS
ncbi:hypothetical protein Bca4012_022232 [Brassica carinata]